MTKRERIDSIIAYFQREMPDAKTELHYESAFQLLVAVVLSAQCTDKRVNMVTPALFEAFPAPQALASATTGQVLHYIGSVSYPNSKALHLIELSRMLVEDFNGKVPSDMDSLTKLPGVGRKTANVVMSVAFGKETMPVDTHVFRVSHRLGLVSKHCTTPFSVEKELTKALPPHLLSLAHHWLILHGRYVCKAVKPKCDQCGLRDFCETFTAAHKRNMKVQKQADINVNEAQKSQFCKKSGFQ